MSDYKPIACGDYDILEVVCMDRSELTLTLRDGEVITGTAVTVESDGAAEYFVVRIADGRTDRIRVDRLERLFVHSRPARFESHEFGDG